MLFFSGQFLLFMALTALACGQARSVRTRVGVLWLASYVFYAAWDWRFLFLILGSTLLDFLVARRIPQASGGRRRLLLGLSLVGNLGSLAVFKYLDFGIATLKTLLGTDWSLLELTLPVGISFYTFQSMSYTIDVYRGSLEPQKSFPRFALYVSFFPQLVAGPIIRASTFLPQIEPALQRFPNRVSQAVPLFVLGLFKKLVIADNLALLADPVFAAPLEYGGADVLLATLAFAGQIYCDFSGYTDMALALGALFGFRFPNNFHSPYLARGPQDFWRRWHISLSTWLRDYLYISLGGSRHGAARTAFALMLTMLLGGLWHGAAWTFVLWGAFHGALLVGQRGLRDRLPASTFSALAPLGTLLFFPLMLLGWMIFRAESAASLSAMLGRLGELGEPTLLGAPLWLPIAFVAAEHVLGDWERGRGEDAERSPLPRFALAGLGLLLCVVLRPKLSEPFIYFQF